MMTDTKLGDTKIFVYLINTHNDNSSVYHPLSPILEGRPTDDDRYPADISDEVDNSFCFSYVSGDADVFSANPINYIIKLVVTPSFSKQKLLYSFNGPSSVILYTYFYEETRPATSTSK